MAMAEAGMRADNVTVRNVTATNAVDPCLFAASEWMTIDADGEEEELVGVVSTTQLIYNSRPTKLGTGCIFTSARCLAKLELEREAISERVASANYMLTAMCRSVSGGYEIDSIWASIVLVVYVCCDPRGRPLLAQHTQLTDLDVQTACAFETYGRGEITRRARLRAAQEADAHKAAEKKSKRQKKDGDPGSSSALPAESDNDSDFDEIDPDTGLPIEDDTASIINDDDGFDTDPEMDLADAAAMDLEDDDDLNSQRADQKVLATKRKRSGKGMANASTADAFGILNW